MSGNPGAARGVPYGAWRKPWPSALSWQDRLGWDQECSNYREERNSIRHPQWQETTVPRSCAACSHADRERIDAELLQGVSFRTVAGRYGLSAPALHRHRAEHLEQPTVDDLLEPADQFDTWRRFDGTEWQRCPTPKAEDLIELHCRPESYRGDFSMDFNCFYIRKTYRLRRSKSGSSG